MTIADLDRRPPACRFFTPELARRRPWHCPTGGPPPDTARDDLRLPNVICVGGSWMVARDATGRLDPTRTEVNARATAALGPSA